MKLKPVVSCLIVSTCWLPGSVVRADVAAPASTQPGGAPPTGDSTVTSSAKGEVFRIRNVRPGIMAWWLDPEHQEEPMEYWYARRAQKDWFGDVPLAPGAIPAVGRIEGIERIVAVNSQNVVLVYGTEQGLGRVRREIEKLDKPSEQIEVEAQFVYMDKSDMARFNIDFSPDGRAVAAANQAMPVALAPPPSKPAAAPSTTGYTIGRVPANFQGALKQLIERNRAKAIAVPRLTTLNRLPASIGFSTSDPLETYPHLLLTTTIGLAVTPTLNPDNSIGLALGRPIRWSLGLYNPAATAENPAFYNPYNPALQPTSQPAADQARKTLGAHFPMPSMISSVRLHDGETIVLSGLRHKTISRGGRRISYWSHVPGIGALGDPKAKGTEKEVLIFVTVRQVRRLVAS